jgi:uncharacterized protein (TIGR02001 family)
MKTLINKPALRLVSARSVFAASPGYADFTGTLAAISGYIFRGIETSEGAVGQGSLNYEHDTGFYASVWGSNIDETLGSTEVDVYGGWKGDLGGVGGDVGAIQYLFPETNEDDVLEEGLDVIDNTDYLELYAGVTLAGLSARALVIKDYFNTDENAIYITGTYTFSLKDDLSPSAQAGWSEGNGADVFVGDSYIDYSLSLTQTFESDFGASFALVNTDLDETEVPALRSSNSPKFVVTLKGLRSLTQEGAPA